MKFVINVSFLWNFNNLHLSDMRYVGWFRVQKRLVRLIGQPGQARVGRKFSDLPIQEQVKTSLSADLIKTNCMSLLSYRRKISYQSNTQHLITCSFRRFSGEQTAEKHIGSPCRSMIESEPRIADDSETFRGNARGATQLRSGPEFWVIRWGSPSRGFDFFAHLILCKLYVTYGKRWGRKHISSFADLSA